ncbi:MAG: AbrB/MazE/SpoVT family DNA-binding domain-containing protein [Anaerolineales bacterium]|nr:AbrB/MazE/SpoVT family DNA-binding domain-containing protein [Anaerolineales bacterium]
MDMKKKHPATVSAKGWVVIPKDLRERYGLTPGVKVWFVEYGGSISLILPPKDPIEEGVGVLAPYGTGSWTDIYLQEKALERQMEDKNHE